MAVLGVHLVALGWLFPHVLMFIVVPPAIFYLLFLWCEITYEVEVGHRQRLIKQIKETDNPITKEVLMWQLILHEEHCVFENLSNDRIGF